MRCLFYAFLLTIVFPASAQAAGKTTITNQELGYSFSVSGNWASRHEGPITLDGQEYQAAYWGEGELRETLPYILVRSVETGKVKAADMTGLNKIAIQSTMNGLASKLKPFLSVQNFYPAKALFSYSVELGDDPDHRMLLNKYVYYTEKGMLEFTMACGFKDTETMVTTNLALKSVQLDAEVAYVLPSPENAFSLGSEEQRTVFIVIAALLVLLGVGLRMYRNRG